MNTAGGWSPFQTHITSEDMSAFNKAMDGLVGAKYEPIAVSTQVVNGMNYKFICNATIVVPGATPEGAMVEIYQPSTGPIHITEIKKL